MSRNKLFAALAAAGCLATSTSSGAVEVNPDGIGQVLLYPYYTVRSSSTGNVLNTLISVGNTTDHVKVVRVRFREGSVGYPVADCNVYLNAHDMWTGAVLPDDGGGAKFLSLDHSCAVPPAPATIAFSNYAYIGDPVNVSLDRTREGFIEIIEMGDYGLASTAAVGSVAEGVQQIGGVPLDCSRAQLDTGAEAQPGTGGLFGRAILINVLDGTEFAYSATALANFNTTRSLWAAADAPGPTLADADPPVSIVHAPELGTIRTQWTQPIDAVSAVLMRESISNEFVLDAGTRSITDWVVTMPTKYYYVHDGFAPTRLFQNPLLVNGACEVVLPEGDRQIFDRESRTVVSWGGSLPPGGAFAARALCWATTVVEFASLGADGLRADTLFGSRNRYAKTDDFWNPAAATAGLVATTFQDGWLYIPLHSTETSFSHYGQSTAVLQHSLVGGATLQFKPDGSTETRAQATYYGLPVIGFAAESYTNGTLTVNSQPVLSNYGGLIGHRYTRNVQ